MRIQSYRSSLCRWLAALVLVATAAGCANPERKAAKSIDYTQEIIQQASAILRADQELKRYPIVVDGFHNDMRVKGRVATPAQKARAERIVWSVQGVKSVRNELDVTPTQKAEQKPGASPASTR